MNKSFTVEVCEPGSGWQTVPVYNVMVDRVEEKHNVENSSMAYFDFSGTVNVRVVSCNRKIESARVRPLSYGITPKVNGDTIEFSLDRPRLLSVEVNGEIFDNLQLFANPIETDAPANIKKFLKDKKNVYFSPGYHKLDSTLVIGSNQEVYVAGGAYVDGKIEINDAENVKLHGRGMIYPHRNMGIHVIRSKNVEIDGVFTTQCAVGGSNFVKVNNVKVMSYYGWGDGFNIFASNDVHYSNVFARTSDDCTTIYATRKGFVGGCRNIVTENSVLWADVAHPFMIGLHGSAKEIGPDAPSDTIENILYRNIDVLDMKEKQIDYQGVFAIVAGDNNVVRDVTFDDIRVEDFRQGKLFDIRMAWNQKYCAAPGRAIENIKFKDIFYNGDKSELSLIIGYDESRRIKGIHFDNLVINGVKITDTMPGKPAWYKTGDMARIFIGEHVEDVTFE
ncbi:MAG: endo-polygalacturonase [Muribaculaceae bacterium]|nr:endo-polygalacturonase [Muribaculaceae bacterium]